MLPYRPQTEYTDDMQPIIRRTITITVTETWTITWQDGHETVWEETHPWPADSTPSEPLLPLTDDDDEGDDENDDVTLDWDAADLTEDDESDVGLAGGFLCGS